MTEQTYPPRLARPGEQFEQADAAGTLHQLTADEHGVVEPRNDTEQTLAIAAGLPTLLIDTDPTRAELRDRAAELDLELPDGASKRELAVAIAIAERHAGAADAAAAIEPEETDADDAAAGDQDDEPVEPADQQEA